MNTWVEVVIETTVAAVDDVAVSIMEEIPEAEGGTQVRGNQVVFWVPEKQVAGVVENLRARASEWGHRGMPVDADSISLGGAIAEEDWRNAWKKYFHATRLTRQLVVVPSWEDYAPEPNDIVVELDPGQAFGTGAHASTQLVLTALQERADRGRAVHRFLDVGTGSGILAIFACKLWPEASGVATDIDELAMAATRENSERNAVGERISASTDELGQLTETFPLVLANIQAHVILAIADELAARVETAGQLVLSGLLSTQAAAVAETFTRDHGFSQATLVPSTLDPEWTGAVLVKLQ